MFLERQCQERDFIHVQEAQVPHTRNDNILLLRVLRKIHSPWIFIFVIWTQKLVG